MDISFFASVTCLIGIIILLDLNSRNIISLMAVIMCFFYHPYYSDGFVNLHLTLLLVTTVGLLCFYPTEVQYMQLLYSHGTCCFCIMLWYVKCSTELCYVQQIVKPHSLVETLTV
jgi:hypothetical protein